MEVQNTSYGQYQYLTLSDGPLFIICEDVSENYSIGEDYQTTLHYQNYWFNQNRAIGTPETMGPNLYQTVAMEDVIDSVSSIGGCYLELVSSNEKYFEYKFFHNSTGVPLSDMNVSLRASPTLGVENEAIITYEYVSLMSDFDKGNEIDFMASLDQNSSANETIEFIDENSNNLLDTGDIFRIYIPPTSNESIINTYELLIGGGYSQGVNNYYGAKYIINWYQGPLESYDQQVWF